MPGPRSTIDDGPIEFNWTIVEGDDVSRVMRLSFIEDGVTTYPDLSAWVISGQVRSTESSGTVLGTVYGDAAADQVSNPGVFTVSLIRSATANFPARCVGDLRFTDDDELTRTLMKFYFTVVPSVTP